MFRNIRFSQTLHKGRFFVFGSVALFALLAIITLLGLGAPRASAQTASFPLSSVVATTTGVNLRDQPDAAGRPIVAMPVNARAMVVGGPFNDAWYWLDYNGTRGYASGRYLVLVDEHYTPVPAGSPTAQPTAVGTSQPAVSPTEQSSGTPQASATPNYTAPTTPGDYTGLWLGELSTGGNVRSGPGLDQKVVKSWWAGRRVLLYQSVTDSKGNTWYRVS